MQKQFEQDFDSIDAMLSFTKIGYKGGHYIPEWTFTTEQYGSNSLRDAKELATRGWANGRKSVERFTAQIEDKVKASLPETEVVYDVTGLDFDMGAVLQGQPECWFDLMPKENLKFVRIGVDHMYSAGANADIIKMRGAAICALIDALESQNYRVELYVGTNENCPDNTGAEHLYCYRVKLKQFNEPLDVDRISFWLCHTASYRSIGFATFQSMNPKVKLEHVGVPHAHKFLGAENFDLWVGPVYIGEEHWRSFESASKFVIDACAKFGVKIKTA